MSENDFFRAIYDYLRYQRNLGFDEIMISGEANENAPPARDLPAIKRELGDCKRCELHKNRTNIVFGEGNPDAELLFIGEGPGRDEDAQARPFVGKAGQLLSRMIQAMGLNRDEVYITNIVKCRPPGNRDPESSEIKTCFPFLESQIRAIRPKVIVTLGRIAACTLLSVNEPVSGLRGKFHDRHGIPVMPTYHPSYLLRQEPDKRPKAEAWADLKKVMALLNLPISSPGDKQ